MTGYLLAYLITVGIAVRYYWSRSPLGTVPFPAILTGVAVGAMARGIVWPVFVLLAIVKGVACAIRRRSRQ